ncbi:MAG: hypothetical protein JSS22_01325 [Proteobacteria bacterium]|nr:hypothetical protein [Pseudomonadota bacterium]
MKSLFGVSLAAAIVALAGMISTGRATAAPRSEAILATPVAMTDIGAARRVHHGRRHRHHRARVYVRGPYRPYYERPYYYVPQALPPFFPFGFGYGLDPSW